jgi:hypothetical protein
MAKANYFGGRVAQTGTFINRPRFQFNSDEKNLGIIYL